MFVFFNWGQGECKTGNSEILDVKMKFMVIKFILDDGITFKSFSASINAFQEALGYLKYEKTIPPFKSPLWKR